MRIKNKKLKLRLIFQEMKDELEQNRLKVVLVPCDHKMATNPGGCIRKVISSNCDWYRDFCSQFESTGKTRSRKFQTKIKRRNVLDQLDNFIQSKEIHSKYASILEQYAEERLLSYENQI